MSDDAAPVCFWTRQQVFGHATAMHADAGAPPHPEIARLDACHEADRRMWAHGVTRAEEQRDRAMRQHADELLAVDGRIKELMRQLATATDALRQAGIVPPSPHST